ncbi:MAG: hypothetical protein [Podoviridae sp. ctKoA10]|nr:MAG: hypothetical protein [Podoviridae sp. ctKoA10]
MVGRSCLISIVINTHTIARFFAGTAPTSGCLSPKTQKMPVAGHFRAV